MKRLLAVAVLSAAVPPPANATSDYGCTGEKASISFEVGSDLYAVTGIGVGGSDWSRYPRPASGRRLPVRVQKLFETPLLRAYTLIDGKSGRWVGAVHIQTRTEKGTYYKKATLSLVGEGTFEVKCSGE